MQLTTPEKVGLSSSRLQRIKTVMQRYVDQNQTAGLLTLVARRGQVVHLETVGYQDIAQQTPLQSDTIFRIYSMTKPVTSVALMMLYEEGHFQLSDPVAQFIPSFKGVKVYVKPTFVGLELADPQREMTIHDLLVHTSGLSYGFYEDSPVEALYRQIDLSRSNLPLAEAIHHLAQIPLLHHPGGAWRYSVSTDVVGHLVELMSGQSLDVFLTERIFQPLGMDETAFYVPATKADRLATLYTPAKDGGLRRLDKPHFTQRFLEPSTMLSGGGGLVSTAADYLRFAEMLLNNGQLNGARLLSRKTVEFMTMNHLDEKLLPIAIGPRPLPGYGFGLGFRVSMNVAQTGVLGSVGEYGWSGMASTYFWVDPREQLIGLLMSQLIPSEGNPFARALKILTYQSIID